MSKSREGEGCLHEMSFYAWEGISEHEHTIQKVWVYFQMKQVAQNAIQSNNSKAQPLLIMLNK